MKTIRYHQDKTHDTCGGWRWLTRYGHGISGGEWSEDRADAPQFDDVTAVAVATMLETVMFGRDGGHGRSVVESVDA